MSRIGKLPIFLANITNDFTADMELASFLVGHHALRGGDDGDTEAVHHSREVFTISIPSQARTRDAVDGRDGRQLGHRMVFQGDLDHILRFLLAFFELVVEDVAFLEEDLRDGFFHVRGGDFYDSMLGTLRIADASQIICYRVCIHLS